MDQSIMGPLLILLFGGGVSAAFYFVARSHVGRSPQREGRIAAGGDADLRVPDAPRR